MKWQKQGFKIWNAIFHYILKFWCLENNISNLLRSHLPPPPQLTAIDLRMLCMLLLLLSLLLLLLLLLFTDLLLSWCIIDSELRFRVVMQTQLMPLWDRSFLRLKVNSKYIHCNKTNENNLSDFRVLWHENW